MAMSDDDRERLAARAEGSGWLYAIVAPEVERVKIGYAQKVDARLAFHQCGSPVELNIHSDTWHTDVRRAEREAHGLLRHVHVLGEWFDMQDCARSALRCSYRPKRQPTERRARRPPRTNSECRPGERLTLASARRSDSAASCARDAWTSSIPGV
jgi:hypothetical protein